MSAGEFLYLAAVGIVFVLPYALAYRSRRKRLTLWLPLGLVLLALGAAGFCLLIYLPDEFFNPSSRQPLWGSNPPPVSHDGFFDRHPPGRIAHDCLLFGSFPCALAGVAILVALITPAAARARYPSHYAHLQEKSREKQAQKERAAREANLDYDRFQKRPHASRPSRAE